MIARKERIVLDHNRVGVGYYNCSADGFRSKFGQKINWRLWKRERKREKSKNLLSFGFGYHSFVRVPPAAVNHGGVWVFWGRMDNNRMGSS